MNLRTRLRAVVDPLPPGSAVTLPADTVRAWLEEDAFGPELADLPAADFGKLLGRAPSTVRTWCADGRLPGAYRLHGREWRIPRSALRALREEQGLTQDEAVDLGAWRSAS